jgi:hypothetical protein
VSEPYDYRAPAPSQSGRPQGWPGTSALPMQALGAPPPDLTQAPHDYRYPPPSGQRQPGPGNDRGSRGKGMDYALKGLGLLGVALVSGLLWYLIRNNPAPSGPALTTPSTQPTGLYQFQPYHGATTETDCSAHSTDRVQKFFVQHPCQSLVRSLYTTTLTNSQKVVTSVAVVRMDSTSTARSMRAISDGTATGHVKDLVEDGVVIPGGPSELQDGGYYSTVKGNRVIIVMTEFVDGALDHGDTLKSADSSLRAVSRDAAAQGIGMN